MQMKKDHVRAFLVVAGFLFLLAVALVPTLHYLERTYLHVQKARADKDFTATMRRLCQSDEASWAQRPDGGFQCLDKHGKRTIRVSKEQL